MTFSIWHLFGAFAACLMIIAYFLVTASFWDATGERYNLANFIGSMCLLLSLVDAPDLRSLIIAGGVAVISGCMLLRVRKRKGQLEHLNLKAVFDWLHTLKPK